MFALAKPDITLPAWLSYIGELHRKPFTDAELTRLTDLYEQRICIGAAFRTVFPFTFDTQG